MVIDFLQERKDDLSSQIKELTSQRDQMLKEIREGEKFLALLKKEQVEPFSVFSPRRLDSPKIRQIDELEQKIIVLKEDAKEIQVKIDGIRQEYDTVSSSFDEVSNLIQPQFSDSKGFTENLPSEDMLRPESSFDSKNQDLHAVSSSEDLSSYHLQEELASDFRSVTISDSNRSEEPLTKEQLTNLLKQLHEVDDRLPADPMGAKIEIKNLINQLLSFV